MELRKGYTFVQVTLNRADGLHILTKATLQQLLDDQALSLFADGLIPQAFAGTDISTIAQWTVAEALHHDGLPQINALVTILLALDAEVNAIVNDENRLLPVAAPIPFEEIDEPVFVSIPLTLGNSIGPSIYDKLAPQEQLYLKESAEVIYQTYRTAT